VADRNRGGGMSCLVFLAFLGSRRGGGAGILSVLLLRLRLGSLGERRGRHAVFGIGNGRVRRHGRRLMNGS
jgi:cytochrome b